MDTTEDGCGHQLALACAKDTLRADSVGEAQGFCFQTLFLGRNGTNDHEQTPSVPLVPMLFGGSYY